MGDAFGGSYPTQGDSQVDHSYVRPGQVRCSFERPPLMLAKLTRLEHPGTSYLYNTH
jgi:hypothetical protein